MRMTELMLSEMPKSQPTTSATPMPSTDATMPRIVTMAKEAMMKLPVDTLSTTSAMTKQMDMPCTALLTSFFFTCSQAQGRPPLEKHASTPRMRSELSLLAKLSHARMTPPGLRLEDGEKVELNLNCKNLRGGRCVAGAPCSGMKPSWEVNIVSVELRRENSHRLCRNASGSSSPRGGRPRCARYGLSPSVKQSPSRARTRSPPTHAGSPHDSSRARSHTPSRKRCASLVEGSKASSQSMRPRSSGFHLFFPDTSMSVIPHMTLISTTSSSREAMNTLEFTTFMYFWNM
mmetsp:Transcript_69995/g.221778  ORF Transcript_69995/g.221778 Transcript_69995/m.221778 type:complete len:289 (-) Transcript_69995:3076-3942(-)